MKKAAELCRFAKVLKRKRGDVVLCLRDMKTSDVLLFVNFPDRVATAPDCVATHLYSTGHATPNATIRLEKMSECKNRVRPEKKKPSNKKRK